MPEFKTREIPRRKMLKIAAGAGAAALLAPGTLFAKDFKKMEPFNEGKPCPAKQLKSEMQRIIRENEERKWQAIKTLGTPGLEQGEYEKAVRWVEGLDWIKHRVPAEEREMIAGNIANLLASEKFEVKMAAAGALKTFHWGGVSEKAMARVVETSIEVMKRKDPINLDFMFYDALYAALSNIGEPAVPPLLEEAKKADVETEYMQTLMYALSGFSWEYFSESLNEKAARVAIKEIKAGKKSRGGMFVSYTPSKEYLEAASHMLGKLEWAKIKEETSLELMEAIIPRLKSPWGIGTPIIWELSSARENFAEAFIRMGEVGVSGLVRLLEGTYPVVFYPVVHQLSESERTGLGLPENCKEELILALKPYEEYTHKEMDVTEIRKDAKNAIKRLSN